MCKDGTTILDIDASKDAFHRFHRGGPSILYDTALRMVAKFALAWHRYEWENGPDTTTPRMIARWSVLEESDYFLLDWSIDRRVQFIASFESNPKEAGWSLVVRNGPLWCDSLINLDAYEIVRKMMFVGRTYQDPDTQKEGSS